MEQETLIIDNTYIACAIAEGFCEGEGASAEQQLQAWAYLIKDGIVWSLQGFYGRNATSLIENGLITKEGIITDAGYDAVYTED